MLSPVAPLNNRTRSGRSIKSSDAAGNATVLTFWVKRDDQAIQTFIIEPYQVELPGSGTLGGKGSSVNELQRSARHDRIEHRPLPAKAKAREQDPRNMGFDDRNDRRESDQFSSISERAQSPEKATEKLQLPHRSASGIQGIAASREIPSFGLKQCHSILTPSILHVIPPCYSIRLLVEA